MIILSASGFFQFKINKYKTLKQKTVNVKFKNDSELATIKEIEPQDFSTTTLEKENEDIKQCTTLEEVNMHRELLLATLEDLKERKV